MMSRAHGSVLVGRSAELGQLAAVVQAAERGSFQLVLIRGESGVGKTRLVREAMRLAGERGFLRLSGRGIDLVGPGVPYGPLVEMLRPITSPLAGEEREPERARISKQARQVFRGLRGGDRPRGHEQAAAFERFLNLLEILAARQPLLLAIDDLQWADRSTLDLLGYLAQALSSLDPTQLALPSRRILLVAAVREGALDAEPLRRLLANAVRLPQANELEVGPLSRDDHDALLRTILGGGIARQHLDRVYERSQGNPFLAEQLVAGGNISTALPRRLRDVLLGQFASLSPPAQRVVEIVSAAQRIDHQALARVAGMPEPALLDAVREAMERSILAAEPTTARYAFRHPLLAEAVYEHLIPGQQIALHADLARSLARSRATEPANAARVAAEIAEHWLKAGEAARALPALVRAGRAASRLGAHAEALTHFRRALERSAADDTTGVTADGRIRLLGSAAAAAEGSGELDEAAEYWERAIRVAEHGADAALLARLRGRLADCRMLGGNLPAAMDGWRHALEAVGPGAPGIQARLMAKVAGGQIILGQLTDAQQSAQAAIEIAGRIGATSEEGLARGSLGAALAMQGRAAAGVEHLRRSLTVAIDERAIEDEAIARSNLAEALHFTGQLDEAIQLLDQGITRVRRAGLDRTYAGTMTASAAYLTFVAGHWDEAVRRCADGLARLPQGVAAAWLSLVQGEVLTERGEFERAAESIATAAALSPGDRVTGWDGPHEQLAILEIHRGRPGAALRLVSQALAVLSGGELTSRQRFLVALGLRAAANLAQEPRSPRDAASGEARAMAEDLIARLRNHARAIAGDADPHLSAELPLAEAEFRRGTGDDDPDSWAAVAAAWNRLQHPLDACYGKLRRAEALLRRSGHRGLRKDVARELTEAWEIATALGARPTTRKIEATARRGGIGLSSAEAPAPQRVALPGDPRGLTPREQQVLRLLLEGRTDREIADQLFIAEKTASVHVSNIKGKFAAASRTEVAVRALELGYRAPE